MEALRNFHEANQAHPSDIYIHAEDSARRMRGINTAFAAFLLDSSVTERCPSG